MSKLSEDIEDSLEKRIFETNPSLEVLPYEYININSEY